MMLVMIYLDRAGEVEADQGEQQGGGGVEAGGEAGVEARHAQPADGGQQPPLLGAGALHQGRVQGLAHLVSTGQVKYCDVTLTRTQGRNSSFMAPREVKEVPAWRSNRGRHPVWKPYGAP